MFRKYAKIVLAIAALSGLAGCATLTTTTAVPNTAAHHTGLKTDPGPAIQGQTAGPYAVAEVIDGDTIDITRAGEKVRLRLIGIDTPETKAPRKPVGCFGAEASARASQLLTSTSVRISTDPTQDRVDRYGRELVYVWLADGSLFNEQMIREGYASEYTYNVAYLFQSEFKAAQADAREHSRGLWSPTTCVGQPTRAAR